MGSESLKPPAREIIEKHLDGRTSHVEMDLFNDRLFVELDNGGSYGFANLFPRPLDVRYRPRDLEIRDLRIYGNEEDAKYEAILGHYLYGDIPQTLGVVDQQLPNGDVSRNFRTVWTASPDKEIVLAGTRVYSDSKIPGAPVFLDLPDPKITHDQVSNIPGSTQRFMAVNEETGEVITEVDDEILGGYSVGPMLKKIQNTLTAPLFVPGVQVPEILLSGVLVDPVSHRDISGVYAYSKPLSITLAEAINMEMLMMENLPEYADQLNLSARMLYHIMKRIRMMHEQEVAANDVYAVLGRGKREGRYKGRVHMGLHSGNWSLVADNCKGIGEDMMYIGDWETSYQGDAMRPELQVLDAGVCAVQALNSQLVALRELPGGEARAINNAIYTYLGLMGVGVREFTSEYAKLKTRFQKLRDQLYAVGERNLGVATSILFWEVCKEVYGYDFMAEYKAGRTKYFDELITPQWKQQLRKGLETNKSNLPRRNNQFSLPNPTHDRELDRLIEQLKQKGNLPQPPEEIPHKKKRKRH